MPASVFPSTEYFIPEKNLNNYPSMLCQAIYFPLPVDNFLFVIWLAHELALKFLPTAIIKNYRSVTWKAGIKIEIGIQEIKECILFE